MSCIGVDYYSDNDCVVTTYKHDSGVLFEMALKNKQFGSGYIVSCVKYNLSFKVTFPDMGIDIMDNYLSNKTNRGVI